MRATRKKARHDGEAVDSRRPVGERVLVERQRRQPPGTDLVVQLLRKVVFSDDDRRRFVECLASFLNSAMLKAQRHLANAADPIGLPFRLRRPVAARQEPIAIG
jgi:hypothetical protein